MNRKKDKTAKQILYDTLRKIRKGWAKGAASVCECGTVIEGIHDVGDLHGYPLHRCTPVLWCVSGAVECSSGFDYQSKGHKEAIDALVKALSIKTKKRANFDKLVAWNDSPRRTKQEVIALIEAARKLV